MKNTKTPSNDEREGGGPVEARSGAAVHPDGLLFAAGQWGTANVKHAASPYPWDKPGEAEPDTEVNAVPGPAHDLPATKEIPAYP